MCQCACCDTDPKEPTTIFTRYEDRSCTDVLVLLLYIVFCVGVVALIFSAKGDGANIDKVIRPIDYAGRICGVNDTVKDKKYGMWPNFYNDGTNYGLKLCVDDCSKSEDPNYAARPYKSQLFVWYCVPNLEPNVTGSVSITLTGDYDSAATLASNAFVDMYTAWVLILLSPLIAVFFSFVYVWLCKSMAGILVWVFILLLIVGGCLLAWALLSKGSDAANQQFNPNRAKAMRAFGYITIVVVFIFLCVIYFLHDRIQIAIEVVKEAGGALADMPGMAIFPIFPLIVGIAYMAFWVTLSVYLFSVRQDFSRPIEGDFGRSQKTAEIINALGGPRLDPVTIDGVTQYRYTDQEFKDSYKRWVALAFFHMLWTVQFVIYFTYVVLAGAVANWYFTPYESGQKKRGSNPGELTHAPVQEACCRTCRFHLGTVALAALIIAIIQFIRAVVKYLEEKSKAASGGEPNRVQKALFCCLNCCLKCVECCLDKVSKNALVWTAIWGTAFVPSVCSSFKLIWANLGRIAALTIVTAFLMFLGKIMVAIVSTGVAAIIFSKLPFYSEHLTSIIMPCLVVFVLSYLVASLLMVLYETTIDCLFLCFLVDEKCNSGSNNMLASESLRNVVQKHQDLSEKYAARQKIGTTPTTGSAAPQA